MSICLGCGYTDDFCHCTEESNKVSIRGLCDECGYIAGHIEGCSAAKVGDLITKREYRSPSLTQLRLEKSVAEAAAKWFELEKHYESLRQAHLEIPDIIFNCASNVYESLGERAVLLLKKE